MKVSVIMPVERIGGDAERAMASVLRQETSFPFELIVISAEPLIAAGSPVETEPWIETPARASIDDAAATKPPHPDNRVRNVVEPNRNPASRRNRAVSVAAGELLAFIDDDAVADPAWLATAVAYLDAHPEVLALGGPDPAPAESSRSELIAETLLATPFIGSGIACHENRPGIFPIRAASDVALVNLFIRRRAFRGFDEAIGYIGEDTALVETLLPHVVYHAGVKVFHRRRAFPGPYLRQRWRYRVKTGQMLVRGSRAHRSKKVQAFLIAGALAILFAPLVALPYYVATFLLGARTTRLPMRYWPALPIAFAMHHATYFFGIVFGALRARWGGALHAR
jgi:glycosyltransferase involved in cell wall biosynthesis